MLTLKRQKYGLYIIITANRAIEQSPSVAAIGAD